MQQPDQGELGESQITRRRERAQRLHGRQMLPQVLSIRLVALAATARRNGSAEVLFGEQALRSGE